MTTAQPIAAPPVLLDHAQAAALLGVSESTLKRLTRAGKIGPSPVKFSQRLVKWRASELADWVSAGCPSRKTWAARDAGGAA